MRAFKPIVNTSRIQVVDVLRGFALFGVLMANMPYDHQAAATNELNATLGFFYDVFINRKFITLFSMLFGFGFYIQLKRARQKGIDFQRYFLKRMGLLFLIGAFHCFWVWNGDIIMSYAVGGIFLLLVKNWSVKKLIVLAVVCSLFLTGILFIGNAVLGWQHHLYDPGLVLEHPVVTTYSEYLIINFRIAPWVNFLQDMPITLVFTFGNMLVGFSLGKLDFFRNPKELRPVINNFILVGLTLGLFCSYLFHLVNAGKLELNIALVWLPFVVIGGMMFQTLAYIAIFVKASEILLFKRMTFWFKFVGRAALSNYIFQSLFYLFVIFNAIHGNGLYEKMTRAEAYMIAVLFFMVQSFMSCVWLKQNHQGPIEYIWKKMAYYRLAFRKNTGGTLET